MVWPILVFGSRRFVDWKYILVIDFYINAVGRIFQLLHETFNAYAPMKLIRNDILHLRFLQLMISHSKKWGGVKESNFHANFQKINANVGGDTWRRM